MPSTSSFFNIINDVYDSASNSLRMSLNFSHTHSSGSGGQLDWDVVWSDAVHNHSANAEGGVLDHGQSMSSASLADEDHPAYVPKSTVTTNGDLFIANGSASVTRLAAGTANYVLTSTGIGSQASWQALAAAINDGSYTGDGSTTNRAIAHGLGKTPKYVKIMESTMDVTNEIIRGTMFTSDYAAGSFTPAIFILTVPDGTSFYVGTVTAASTANGSARVYYWVAQG